MAAAVPRLRMPVSLVPDCRSTAVNRPWRGGEVCPLRARAESADSLLAVPGRWREVAVQHKRVEVGAIWPDDGATVVRCSRPSAQVRGEKIADEGRQGDVAPPCFRLRLGSPTVGCPETSSARNTNQRPWRASRSTERRAGIQAARRSSTAVGAAARQPHGSARCQRPRGTRLPPRPISGMNRGRVSRAGHTSTPNRDPRGSANERERRCRSIYRGSATRRRLGPG